MIARSRVRCSSCQSVLALSRRFGRQGRQRVAQNGRNPPPVGAKSLETELRHVRAVCRGGSLAPDAQERFPFGGRSVDYRHLLLPLSRKPQALRQVVRELVAQFGPPWPELWQALCACYAPDELEAARRLAPWLDRADWHGLARVGTRMAAAHTAMRPVTVAVSCISSQPKRSAAYSGNRSCQRDCCEARAKAALLSAMLSALERRSPAADADGEAALPADRGAVEQRERKRVRHGSQRHAGIVGQQLAQGGGAVRGQVLHEARGMRSGGIRRWRNARARTGFGVLGLLGGFRILGAHEAALDGEPAVVVDADDGSGLRQVLRLPDLLALGERAIRMPASGFLGSKVRLDWRLQNLQARRSNQRWRWPPALANRLEAPTEAEQTGSGPPQSPAEHASRPMRARALNIAQLESWSAVSNCKAMDGPVACIHDRDLREIRPCMVPAGGVAWSCHCSIPTPECTIATIPTRMTHWFGSRFRNVVLCG